MEDINKNIDESWKETVGKEKDNLAKQGKATPPEPDFRFFLTSLALQASISLGIIANPVTQKIEQDSSQAKFLIDTIAMLKEKTKGNLTKEETESLDNILYELRMQYVSQVSKTGDKK